MKTEQRRTQNTFVFNLRRIHTNGWYTKIFRNNTYLLSPDCSVPTDCNFLLQKEKEWYKETNPNLRRALDYIAFLFSDFGVYTSQIFDIQTIYRSIQIKMSLLRCSSPAFKGLLLSSWILLSSSLQLVMAVDRSKFRTCSQTSFCRRHRDKAPDTPRQFQVDVSSMKFSFDDETESNETNDNNADGSGNGSDAGSARTGIWSSLFGGKKSPKKLQEYLGPAPVFTALLKSMDSKEELQLNLHLQNDGVARLRLTETKDFIESLENLQKKEPRWTSDELVLKEEGMIMVEHVQFIPAQSNLLQSYIERVFSTSQITSTNHFVALKYNSFAILIRLDSFELHMLDDAEQASKDPPMVSINAQNLMYFEQRRSHKIASTHLEFPEDQLQQEDVDRRTQEETKPKTEKKIVGYWEDGKAIYDDGSREEDDEVDNTAEKAKEQDHIQEQEDTEGLWEEKFQSHLDSKPYGPMSVGLDITFPQSQHLFGIPEHASETLLRKTVGEGAHYKEPYRLYNLDVFEYELDETMALYGSIPFLVSHRVTPSDDENDVSARSSTVGVFYFNPSETFIDVFSDPSSSSGTATHWMSESGILDIFLLPGSDKPSDIYKQYARLTGYPYLPPSFALGYHQCRWNYRDENDALTVHANFEKYDYPYDVLWLDIEHTDGKRYFTWDHHQFPNPESMQQKIEAQGRKMVTIVDPHIKRDNRYYIHKQAESKKLYIKDKDGKDFDGWCWPGSSSYPDFTNAKVREWWATQFSYNNYKGSTPSLYTWNDMNEPSVFNGPEVSMQKDMLSLDDVEHREWHNLYGMTFHRATAEGLILRNSQTPSRPFVLSRSFFAGSQQYGPM